MQKWKQILLFFLSLLTGVGILSGFATPVLAAGSRVNAILIDLPRSGDPNKSGWGHPQLNYMGGWSHTYAANHYTTICLDSYSGQIAYCIEPGVVLDTGDSFGQRGEDFWDNYPARNPTIPPAVIKSYLGRVLQYGFSGTGNLDWNSSNGTHAEEISHMIATQLLVWETIVGERDSQFNKVNANAQGKSNITEEVAGNHPLRGRIFAYYDSMVSSVKNHTKLPSFFSENSAGAGTYELKWNGKNYTVTLTDNNNVLGSYHFSSSVQGLSFSASGNKLTITAEKAIRGAIPIKAERVNSQRKSVVVWSDGSPGTGKQDFVSYGATVSDPVSGYMNLEIKTGNMKLLKTSEDGKVDGISFTISGEGYKETKTTGKNGEIDITDLNPGVYTVTEQSIGKYEPQAVQRVTIVSGQTTTVSFNNVLKRGSLKVTKTSEDRLVEGMKFHLYGTSLSGQPVDEYAITNASGIASFENILISGKTPYTLEEVDTPNRYVVPDIQNATIQWKEVTHQSFRNILKKFRVTVTKSDVETGLPQGNGSLAGATYGLYKGETLVDSYTTDAKGQFTTGYYICDKDWTIREINPSQGYLLDGTIYKVGASPTLYTIELNSTANDVVEQIVKGNIAIIKHSDDGSTGIETPEDGAEFAVYLKSAGNYEQAKKTERDYLTCDKNGFAQTKNMPYGIYTVHQTKGWDGRELMKDFDVLISKDGQTYRYLINNAAFKSYIKIVKVDAETGKTIPYAGAGFQLYRPDGSLITQSFTYPTPTTIDTFYTNDEGYLITPEKLDYGTGYSMVEVQAPFGYVLNTDPVFFDVTQDNSTSEGEITVVEITKENMAQKGNIQIGKSGEVFTSVTESEGVYQPVYDISGLAGAVYEIIAAEDIYTLDGSLRSEKGTVVDTITTDENGKATSKALYLGKYKVKEITAPNGMVVNKESHLVELVYAGQDVEITDTATSFYNERQKVQITLNKLLEQDKTFGIGMNNEIFSVTFGLYAEKDLTAADGTVIPADGLLEVVTVNEKGLGTCKTDLPFGSYYLKELAVDHHYLISDTKYPVIFKYEGQDIALVEIKVNNGEAIENNLLRGKIQGLKTSEDGKGLEGALIGLFASEETTYTKDTAIQTVTSDKNGNFSFDNIPYGTWLIREIEAPKGFVLSEEVFTAVVDKDEVVIKIAIENIRIRGNVQLRKVDKDYPDNKLTGAEFKIYRDSNENEKFDKEDELLGTLEESGIGVYGKQNLTYGGYFIKETKAPDGFYLDKNAYYVFVTEHGKTYDIENEAGKGFVNAAQVGSLRIIKTSSDGKVDGFSFCVTGKNGYTQVFKTNKDGIILIENLRIGEYTVSEVSDGVSKSYILPADQKASVLDGAATDVSMFNKLKETPKTGDNSNPTLWYALMGLAGVGTVLCSILGFKKRKKEK